MQLLRVDMSDLRLEREDLPESYREWAGRGFIAKVLENEVPPLCHPLGPENKLIFVNGFFGGMRLSSAGRLSAGGKSPLTGGVKESNAGGTAGDALARVGLRAIIVDGQPAPASLYLLVVGRDRAELVPADEYKGMGTFALSHQLHERFGKKVAIICIGQTGEMKMAAAGVAVSDTEGYPNRYAGRGGMGALMGAKGLKAIVLEDSREPAPLHDAEAFKAAHKAYNTALLETPSTAKMFPELSTLSMLGVIHKLGGIPTRNFRTGTFECFENMNAEKMREVILARGGEGTPTHACMPGCIVRCSNVYPDEMGKTIVSPLEYENVVMLGQNLGIGSLDQIARLNYLCNDFGVDTIETGAAIGVAMEAGIIPFDDFDGAERLLREMAEGTPLGRVLGQGAAVTGQVYGVERVPVVKGQSLAAYDPRAIKGMGIGYLTCPQGADHTACHTIKYKVDHHSKEGQIEASREAQIDVAAWDTINICNFLRGAIEPRIQIVIDLYNAAYGTGHSPDFVRGLGVETLRAELKFNRAAGFTRAADRYRDFFRQQKLPPYDVVFDVSDEEIDRFWSFLVEQ